MKEKILNWFKERNNLHYVIGAKIGVLSYLLAFEAYQMIGRFLIAVVLTMIASMIWEGFWLVVKKIKPDVKDIGRSVIGGAIGGAIAMIVHIFIIGKFI